MVEKEDVVEEEDMVEENMMEEKEEGLHGEIMTVHLTILL